MVTGTNMFARSMGSALGIAVFGAIANASLEHRIGGHATHRSQHPARRRSHSALHLVFVASAVVAAVLLVAVAIDAAYAGPGFADRRSIPT